MIPVVLAVIAARGGSKRVPGKNLRPLGGRPLIRWSIDVVKDMPGIGDILVSTDEPEIANVARAAGALVPWLRPAHLASDTASSVDVCVHALDWYEKERGQVDGLLLLQPTSPFRRRESVERGLELFAANGRRPVVGVAPAASHPLLCFRPHGPDGLRPYVEGGQHLRSQDLPPAYVVNGAFYLITPGDLRARRSFFGDDALALLMMRPEESIDIDTEWDLQLAEAVLGRALLA